jgi:putative Ca2+/H+ antiporter (TMEM165/GDT1 family)
MAHSDPCSAQLGETFDLLAFTRGIGRARKSKFIRPVPPDGTMEALLVSTGVVALAEIGDKTQLLALVLAARYRKPAPIAFGILIATLVNHGLAAWLGALAAGWLGPDAMHWVLGLGFLAMAGWCLVPDKAEDGPRAAAKAGAFLATLVAFFLVEIGDKTQIATVALAARFDSLLLVTAGTTFGMMLVNVPAVLCGEGIARLAPLKLIRIAAASLFAILGAMALLRLDFGLLG